jgi:uncharacterized protein (TIGR02118 family)
VAKMVVLRSRRPEIDPASFQTSWAERLGPVTVELPGLMRCVQSRPLLQGYAKGPLLYDAFEEWWFADDAAADAALASACAREVSALAAEICIPARTVVLPVDVVVAKDGAIPENAVKNVEFVNRRPGMPLDAFFAYWREVHGPLAATIPVVRRYEQNHARRRAYRDGAPLFDGFAVTWFDSTQSMRDGTRTQAYADTRADEPRFLPDGHLPIIIARETTIFDVRGGGPGSKVSRSSVP